MKTPVHYDLERLDPIVDRLFAIALARLRGTITEREYVEMRRLYHLQFATEWAKP